MDTSNLNKYENLCLSGPEFNNENDREVAESQSLLQIYQEHPHIAEILLDYLSACLYKNILGACSEDVTFLEHINDSGEAEINIMSDGVKCWWLDHEIPIGEINFGERFQSPQIVCYINIETPYELGALGLKPSDIQGLEENLAENLIEAERHEYRKDQRLNAESFLFFKTSNGFSQCGVLAHEKNNGVIQSCRNAISNTLFTIAAKNDSRVDSDLHLAK